MTAILQDIVYEGGSNVFVWKSPIEDFSYGSSLTVGESQEALFIKGGVALDLFGPGNYRLETNNIPLLGKAVNMLYGGDTPFHCSVYYINKNDHLAIKWGTDSKIEYTDPQYKIPLKIGMSGEMSLAVKDSRKLIVKLLGTENTYNHDSVVNHFRGLLITKLKPLIANYMVNNRVSIFDVDAHLGAFNSQLLETMKPVFDEYGMDLIDIGVTAVAKPDGERDYEKFKRVHFQRFNDIESAKTEAETKAIGIEREAEALAKKRETEGYTIQQEMSYEIAKTAAGNESAGPFTGVGVGLGTMGAVAGKVGETINQAINDSMHPQSNNSLSPEDALLKAKKLLDAGLITEEDYNNTKNNILSKLGDLKI